MAAIKIETSDQTHRGQLIDATMELSKLAIEQKADPLAAHKQAMAVFEQLASAQVKVENVVTRCTFFNGPDGDVKAEFKSHDEDED